MTGSRKRQHLLRQFAGVDRLGTVTANMGWLFLEKAIRMFVGIFIVAWMARYLGPESFGTLSFAVAFVAIFEGLATLGLKSIVIRELTDDTAHAKEVLGTALILHIVGAVLAILVIIAAITVLQSNDSLSRTMVTIISAGLLFKSGVVVRYWYEAQIESRYAVQVELGVFLVVGLIKITLILGEAPLLAFAWVIFLESMLLFGGLLAVYAKRSGTLSAWHFRSRRAVTMLRDSWPLIFSSMVLMVQARIDQIMLREISGVAEVGYYSVSLGVVEAAAFSAVILHSALMPTIVAAKRISEAEYERRLLDFYRLNFIVSLCILIPLAIFSQHIIGLLFGTAYQPAGFVLALMSSRLFFAHMGVARSVFLLTENMLRYSLVTMVIGTLLNICCNLILIPRYDAIGAVVATIISFAVTTFVIDMFYTKAHKNIRLTSRAIFSFYLIGGK